MARAEWSAQTNLFLTIHMSGYLTSVEVYLDEPLPVMYEENSNMSAQFLPYIRPDILSVAKKDKLLRQGLQNILESMLAQSSPVIIPAFRGLYKPKDANKAGKSESRVNPMHNAYDENQKLMGSHRQFPNSRHSSRLGSKGHSRKHSDIKITMKKDYASKREIPGDEGSFDVNYF